MSSEGEMAAASRGERGPASSADRVVGAFVFPEVWRDPARFRALVAGLRDHAVNVILTESDTYDLAAIDAVHDMGLRFYAGVACFSDHATNFRKITDRPELRPILETGEPREPMEWYVGISPTDRRHQEDILAAIRSITAAYPIDGLFLDFVRWPVHWEIELRPGRPRAPDSSFDAATLAQFKRATGV